MDGEYFVGEVVGDLAEEDLLGHSAGVGVDKATAVVTAVDLVVAVAVHVVRPAAAVVAAG